MHTHSVSSAATTVWLRTQPLHEARRLAEFRQTFAQVIGGIQPEPLHGQALAAAASVTMFGRTVIQMGELTPARCVHSGAGGDDDDVMLAGMPRGSGMVKLRSRQFETNAGDAMFVRPGDTQEVVTPVQAQQFSVLLSRARLAAMGVDVDAVSGRNVRKHPGSVLLARYVHLLREDGVLATPELCRAAMLHLHDLAAVLAGAGGDVAHQAQQGGVRAARLLAVKKDIACHASEPALSISAVAQRQGITPRYLQMLLHDEGTSFREQVLQHRLALAHRLLGDERERARSISAIAFEAGFGDLSHFNRSFRRRFGMTPSDARALARRL